jgi:hypothetical protein
MLTVLIVLLVFHFAGPPAPNASERPPEGRKAHALLARRAPSVGESAPDFVLTTRDGEGTIRRSEFHEARPLVLIFGSHT